MKKSSNNAVVQLFVEKIQFNWIEPYKTTQQDRAWGSAFFIDDQGHLVSNYHVVSGATNIQIQLPSLGKERLKVNVVGVCPYRDVALLKVSEEAHEFIKKNLGSIEHIECGDSDVLTRSQKVSALGYPLGQEALKVTEGIVSGRQDVNGESFIQITAALNPGNSGGPCVDEQGQVIGINSAAISEAQNIGYIIPISDVRGIINDLFKIKLLRNPVLGCELNYGTRDMLSYFGIPEPGGLYVACVYKKSLFEQAGIQEGDVLYEINGYQLGLYGDINVPWSEDKEGLTSLVNRLRIGEKVDLVLYRKDKRIELSLNFDVFDPLPVRIMFPPYEKTNYEIIGGMVVMPLALNHLAFFVDVNSFLIDYRLREKQYEPKLIVTSILSNSQTQHARIVFIGDILEEVNGKKVRTLDDFKDALLKTDAFLTVKTENKKFMVLSWEKILSDEESLAQENLYQNSFFFKHLQKKSS